MTTYCTTAKVFVKYNTYENGLYTTREKQYTYTAEDGIYLAVESDQSSYKIGSIPLMVINESSTVAETPEYIKGIAMFPISDVLRIEME